ncbi:S49 family peptidase [Candidatus Woesebacteria bacterium]|nr:S49 family peptidase [Candidatus Woesebacteria bacterium]
MQFIQKITHFVLRLIRVFLLGSAASFGMLTTIILLIVFTIAISSGADGAASPEQKFSKETVLYGKEDAKNTFLAIRVNGVIMGEQAGVEGLGALFTQGLTYGYSVKEQLMEVADKNEVAGVILMIDSPGGTIFGSSAIADGVQYYKEKTHKPVITYVAGMAASGGYWSAASADLIMADHGTAIGSIGVIFGPIKYYDTVTEEDGGAFMGGVVTQGGIETTYITAGRSKDIGNPYRKLTKDEVAGLQRSVDDSYKQFVQYVSLKRKLPVAKITTEVGAMIYGETQAVELGLIDAIGSKQDAFALLAQKAGVAGDAYKVVSQHAADDFMSVLLSSFSKSQPPSVSSRTCALHSQVLAFHGDVLTLCP